MWPDIERMVAFLRAQLDDDEAFARNAFAEHNNAVANWRELWSGAVQVGPEEDPLLTQDSQITRHIIRHDPARVLRQVAAHREILDDLVEWLKVGEVQPGTTWNDDAAGAEVAEMVIRRLASAYANETTELGGAMWADSDAARAAAVLRLRLDAVERAARLAQPGPWHIGNAVDPTGPCNVHTFPKASGVADCPLWPDAEHIALHNPLSVLAQVAAGRAILRLWESAHEAAASGELRDDYQMAASFMDSVIRNLAAAYPDRGTESGGLA